MNTGKFFILSFLCLWVQFGICQQTTQTQVLQKIHQEQQKKYDSLQAFLKLKLAEKKLTPNNPISKTQALKRFDIKGYPVFTDIFSDNPSAITISTTKAKKRFKLTGKSSFLQHKLGMWDGGAIYTKHQEFNWRINQKDSANFSYQSHATHVCGTLMAAGLNSQVRGMVNDLPNLIAYDFGNEFSTIPLEASNLLLSNHSYGSIAGWLYNGGSWYFYGNKDSLQDYKFGNYSTEAQMWDSISYNAPYYQMVAAAGNVRTSNGPKSGASCFYFDPNQSTWIPGTRKPNMSSNDSFTTIPTYGNAKNIITVGSVNKLQDVYNNNSVIEVANSSSWGPTKDGRIKPDIVAPGINILSTSSGRIDAYEYKTGTSMSSPAVTGSLGLLQEFYYKKHNQFLRAASLKGLLIHTADDIGISKGPDYQMGWGLMNTHRAVEVIDNSWNTDTILEKVLFNQDSFVYNFNYSGIKPLVATLCWTDAPATVNPNDAVFDSTLKLVNDLDLRIMDDIGNTYYPWILQPNNPLAAATTGDNYRDNCERVEVPTAIPSGKYKLLIKHKQNLQRGSQAFSLILSGIQSNAYCSSSSQDSSGLQLQQVTLNGQSFNNTSSCKNYLSVTKTSIGLSSNQKNYIQVKTTNCSGNPISGTAKIFIDWNNNGSWNDANEQIGAYTLTNINTQIIDSFFSPFNLPVEGKIPCRIILSEQNDTSKIFACGSYAKGQTIDVWIQVEQPNIYAAITDISYPSDSICASTKQPLLVQISNRGKSSLNKIPVDLTINDGSSSLLVSDTLESILQPNLLGNYTTQKVFDFTGNKTYTITAKLKLSSNQDTTDNSYTQIVKIANTSSTPNGIAEYCNGNTILQVQQANPKTNYCWYANNVLGQPIAIGTNNTLTGLLANPIYIGAGLQTNIGIASKNIFPNGGGYTSLPSNKVYLKFVNNSSSDLTLKSAKLFSGYSGRVTLKVADIAGTNPDGSYLLNPIYSEKSIMVKHSLPTAVKVNYTVNDPSDTGFTYSINLPLNRGQHYLFIETDSNATVFSNNNITGNSYPFGNTQAFAISGNQLSSNSYYPALYNMYVQSNECPSSLNPVTITSPTIPQLLFLKDSLYSNCYINNQYQWYFEGMPMFAANSNYYKATDSGNYYYTTTDSFGCTLTSPSLLYDPKIMLIDTPDNKDSVYNFMVYPNPASSILNIKFSIYGKAPVSISIKNMLGQLVFKQDWIKQSGNVLYPIDVSHIASGIYFVDIVLRTNQIKRKIVIIK